HATPSVLQSSDEVLLKRFQILRFGIMTQGGVKHSHLPKLATPRSRMIFKSTSVDTLHIETHQNMFAFMPWIFLKDVYLFQLGIAGGQVSGRRKFIVFYRERHLFGPRVFLEVRPCHFAVLRPV